MARRFSNKLAAKQVMAITKPGKHSDGNGLYLLVKPNGNRSWVLILIGDGQRREMGLGNPESVSLATARKLAAEAKAAFDEGRDPIAERVEARPSKPALASVVERYDRQNTERGIVRIHHAQRSSWDSPRKTPTRNAYTIGSTASSSATCDPAIPELHILASSEANGTARRRTAAASPLLRDA